MGMMDKVKVVPNPPTPNEPDPDQNLLVRPRKVSKRAVLIALCIVALLVGVGVASRFLGGSDTSASASEAARVVTKVEAPVASTPAATPAACQGDLTQLSEQRQWYCKGLMPWKQAVDAELTRLDERGTGGGVPSALWILIGVLAANGVITWIILLRRRKSA